MKRAIIKCVTIFKCYQSLIVWGICAGLVVMTFFHRHLPGEWWIIVLAVGVFVNFYIICKQNGRYPLPIKFRDFVIVALIISGIFAFLNFFLGVAALGYGTPRIIDGQYVLDYKGTIVKFISEQEYHHLKCIEQRFIAGHASFFYAATMYVHLYSRQEDKPEEKEEKKESKFDFLMKADAKPMLPKQFGNKKKTNFGKED